MDFEKGAWMGITLDTSKLEALRGRLEGLKTRLNQAIADRLLERIAAGWSASSPSAAGEAPASVTGQLAESLHAESNEDGLRVGTELAYGRALELGTERMAARPWLRPAVEEIRGQAASIAAEILSSRGDDHAGT